MPKVDATRWNERYRTAPKDWYSFPRSFLTENIHMLGTPGLALDAAMGIGANAEYLLANKWEVIGLDISDEAVFMAKSRCPQIQAAVIDLEYLHLPANYFDLVLNMYFLDRRLWPTYRQSIKPGGFFMMETLLFDMVTFAKGLNPEFLLQPDELRLAFLDWDILLYQEGWVKSDHGNEKAVASLIARKPQIS